MVEGLRSLDRKLRRAIPNRVAKNIKVQMAVAADKIVATAEGLVSEKTGDLKNSIGWVWGTDIPDGAISLGSVGPNDSEFVITVFAGNSDAFYARWVEFGTQNASPHPYFFPAYRLNKRGTRTRINRAIRKGLLEGSR